jgi:hypothetical protein
MEMFENQKSGDDDEGECKNEKRDEPVAGFGGHTVSASQNKSAAVNQSGVDETRRNF